MNVEAKNEIVLEVNKHFKKSFGAKTVHDGLKLQCLQRRNSCALWWLRHWKKRCSAIHYWSRKTRQRENTFSRTEHCSLLSENKLIEVRKKIAYVFKMVRYLIQ